eukprot:1336766-Amorphochlora_amoeboformis.AAC.1
MIESEHIPATSAQSYKFGGHTKEVKIRLAFSSFTQIPTTCLLFLPPRKLANGRWEGVSPPTKVTALSNLNTSKWIVAEGRRVKRGVPMGENWFLGVIFAQTFGDFRDQNRAGLGGDLIFAGVILNCAEKHLAIPPGRLGVDLSERYIVKPYN